MGSISTGRGITEGLVLYTKEATSKPEVKNEQRSNDCWAI